MTRLTAVREQTHTTVTTHFLQFVIMTVTCRCTMASNRPEAACGAMTCSHVCFAPMNQAFTACLVFNQPKRSRYPTAFLVCCFLLVEPLQGVPPVLALPTNGHAKSIPI